MRMASPALPTEWIAMRMEISGLPTERNDRTTEGMAMRMASWRVPMAWMDGTGEGIGFLDVFSGVKVTLAASTPSRRDGRN